MVIVVHIDGNGLYEALEFLLLHCPDEWSPAMSKMRALLDHLRKYKKETPLSNPMILENLPVPIKQKLDPIMRPIPPKLPPSRPRSTRKIPLAQ
jgi:hypothetical protein